jgi:NTP pyrophosphatase (non-canonical NTP hydrolase)
MSDSQTTVADLRAMIDTFVAERDWRQFHTPKNLSMSLAIEAAELMEHFQWLTPEESLAVTGRPEKLQAIGEEIADVLAYLLSLANAWELDLSTAMREKLVKNARKYPVEQYRGRFGPEDMREGS